MASLNICLHCGSTADFMEEQTQGAVAVFAKCTGCGIRTPAFGASLEFSAKDKVAGLWNTSTSEEWPAWVQPTGAHDAYSKGAKVTHKGKSWMSNVDANVWEPGASAWTAQ